MTLPGYARPNAVTSAFDYFDIGKRRGSGPGSVIEWRPVGQYLKATVRPTWGIEPGKFSFSLHPNHPLVDSITNVKRTCYHFRAGYNGLPALTGRIFDRDYDDAPGRGPWTYSGYCNKYWLQCMNAWVNNHFPPELQINLTGKNDIRFGDVDPTLKAYVSSVATRLNVPVHVKLPVRTPAWTWPDLEDVGSLQDLIDIVMGGDKIALAARFPSLKDLFSPTTERLELGVAVDLFDGRGTSPQVFNTSSLAALQSIIDRTSDGFLNLSRLLVPANNGLYSLSMDRAGYVFDTKVKRPRQHVQFRTDGGQVAHMKYNEHHADRYMSIVGGKSPSLINDAIETGANLGISAVIALLATIPGLGGIGGLSVVVGDLFDNIFFAYEVFWDSDIRDDIGQDDALPEGFTDNTASHALEGYSVAHKDLAEHGGTETLVLTVATGTADGRGISFGVDNNTPRRYQLGDIVTAYDRGNVVEQYVSEVEITDEPGKRLTEQPTIGRSKRSKGLWDNIFEGFGETVTAFDAIANSI